MAKERSNRAATRLARGMALAVLVGGVASTWLAARVSRERGDSETAQVFAAECAAMRNAVSRQLSLYFDVLESIGKLHELSDTISRESFDEFTQKGMQFQKRVLSSYGFVQRIPHDIRAALAEKGDGALSILDRAPDGSTRSADARPEYFPLVYQNPANALGFPLGLDLAGLPGLPAAILAMNERMGPAVATAMQVQDRAGRTGYYAFSPLFQMTREGRAIFAGFTISILWPQQILETALENTAVRDVLVRFHDPQTAAANARDEAAGLAITETIEVAGTPWTFEAVATPEYLEAHRSRLPAVILAAGLAITALATATLVLLANRTRRVEELVRQRTRDLEQANVKLSDAMQERMRLESEILDISEREKQQLGHDLHDSLGQKLTGAVFLSRVLGGQLVGADEATREQASKMTEVLKDSVAQVRRMARGLSPVELGKEGLAGALHRLTEETSTVYGISCLFHRVGDLHPSAKAAHHLYAIAMEAVNNALKHGGAKEIVVELAATDRGGRLSIEDDGRGFDPAAPGQTGMGLRIMQYRAGMIDGHATIAPRPEGGMIVECEFRG